MASATATRDRYLVRGLAILACAAAWLLAAAYLWRTTVPSIDVSGFDEHRYFGARELARAHSYSRGADALWLLGTLAKLAALVVLTRRAPRMARGLGLGRVGSAIVVGMVVMVTLWAVSVPFGLARLWWQHHWGLAPFDVIAWLISQRVSLGASAVFATATIAIAVGLAVRLGARWWIAGAPAFIAIVALFAFLSGWLGAAGSHPIRSADLSSRVERIERVEGVDPTVRVLPVHDWTDQANAFAAGFGPSTHVVLWDTLLDGRFTAGEVDVVVAHELGHVKRRHVMKAIGWFALFAFPAAYLVAAGTRRRGGLRHPANVPLALLVLTVASLVAAPFQNVVSRRYEAEADWRALEATQDPVSARKLFQSFERTSLADPDPPLLDYLWLENHPTLMQRIAMAELYRSGRR